MFDVLIVGSGPAALACLSGVREPFALDDLSALQLERAHQRRSAKTSVAVVDPNGWLHSWKKNFKALDIQHLRSPVLAHPDMFDPHALLAYADAQGRMDELVESGCGDIRDLLPLGQSQIGLWKLPSTKLFVDFCEDLVERLAHDFVQDKVLKVNKDEESGVFHVTLESGKILQSKAVILATGTVGDVIIPPGLSEAPGLISWDKIDSENTKESTKNKNNMNIEKSPQSILVVGGGLTAVQAAQKCVRTQQPKSEAAASVTLCSRRPLVERHFDLPLEWFDRRTTTKCMSDFYHQSLEDRFALLADTRGGGSVPKVYMRELERMRKEQNGRFQCLVSNDRLEYKGMTSSNKYQVDINGKVQEFTKVVVACGMRANCHSSSLYQSLLETFSTANGSSAVTEHGYPNLTEDLEWMTDNLFVVGGMGGLNTGPDAANLTGMRRAAQVVVRSLGLRQWLREESSNVYRNPFDAFLDDDDDDETDTDDDDNDTVDNDAYTASATDKALFPKGPLQRMCPPV